MQRGNERANPAVRGKMVVNLANIHGGAERLGRPRVPTNESDDDAPPPSPSRARASASASLVPARCGVVEHVRRRALVWPDRGPSARFAQWIATGLPARVLCHLADHMPVLRSDVRDVVYLNWLVPSARARPYLPPPLTLHELGDAPSWTAVTVLTYRHGGFGPAFLGPVRRLLPSPWQSNWRLYLAPEEGHPSQDAVYFLTNALSSSLYVLGSRLFSDGLPAHRAAVLRHESIDGVWTTTIDPGSGSGPDLSSEVRVDLTSPPGDLPEPFGEQFASAHEAVAYLVSQSRALNLHRWNGRVRESRIHVPIDPARVRAAEVLRVESHWLSPLVEGCPCFAFYVPALCFEALGETDR